MYDFAVMRALLALQGLIAALLVAILVVLLLQDTETTVVVPPFPDRIDVETERGRVCAEQNTGSVADPRYAVCVLGR